MTARRPLPLLLLLVAGCGGIGVRPADRVSRAVASGDSLPRPGKVSARTEQLLRRYDLDGFYPGDLPALGERLRAEAKKEPLPGLLFALAEVEFLEAERGRSPEGYARAAGYAYHYLFRTVRDPGEDYDPQFRVGCELYNASVTGLLAAREKDGLIPLADPAVPVAATGFDYRPDEIGPARLCAAFRVTGLANQHRTYGLGVPLIGTRDPAAPPPEHGFHPSNASFPVTAFLHFDGGLDAVADPKARRLELINPLTTQRMTVRGRAVPLETDLTTPLAFYLGQTDLERMGLIGFVRPDTLADRAGLHALQPYRPGKVPVVFVHGLLSSPATWAPMYNDLLSDPVIRDRYQFWVYFYPTGNAYLATAAQLRAQLASLRGRLDPDGRDPALSEMVFVGHSMGGLISRLLTIDSGDDFWRVVSPDPIDRLNLTPRSRAELRNTFYFARQPCVTRAVFLGTPHRGSRLSPSPAGRLAARLAGVPKRLMATVQDLVEDNPGVAEAFRNNALPTSVDLLAPDAPALRLIAHRPRPAAVRYHSVIGVSGRNELLVERLLGGGYKQPSDGVVPYASAHLEDATSELVVPADHFRVHQHPLSILEVRRILLEHLRDAAERLEPVRPAFAR
ncbi:MAG: esterase/lipase family protein [Gemmataceae bacterium]